MPFEILDLDSLKNASLQKTPFPYLIIDNFIRSSALQDVIDSFPTLASSGSYSLCNVSCEGAFADLMQEMQSPELRNLIGLKLGIDLADNPCSITLSGYTTEKDGNIQIDSESILITVLLYLNPDWQDTSGNLRLLYNGQDLHNYAAEVPPEAGRCLIYKVTNNCWHGHEVFNGERKSIQLNYMSSDKNQKKQLKLNRFSSFLKKLFSKTNEANPTH
jgi:SM-20-related protein